MEGFSFCGVPITRFGLQYVPQLKDTYFYDSHVYNLNEQQFAAHDGGYFYGATVQPKLFTLRCYFYDTFVNSGMLAKVGDFFHRGKTGKLVFEKRDWMYYEATVVGLDLAYLTSKYNGFVTITMKAYYPFARSDKLSLEQQDFVSGNIVNNSALILQNKMPSTVIVSQDQQPLSEQTNFILYNGGLQKAACTILIKGDFGDGVTIENKTTGQKCTFLKSNELDGQQYLLCDSLNGKVIATDGTKSEYKFICHDDGFIDIQKGGPIDRNVIITTNKDDSLINSYQLFSDDSLGKYVYIINPESNDVDLVHDDQQALNATWAKITRVVDGTNAYADYAISGTTVNKEFKVNMSSDKMSFYTDIVRMNQLVITPKSSMTITRLQFIYKPTFK